jgi:hypothetical protein
LINQANELKQQSRGFSNFGDLPYDNNINSSNTTPFPSYLPPNKNNIVANTPFSPFANYGQFSNSGSPATQPTAQNHYPDSYPYSYPFPYAQQ